MVRYCETCGTKRNKRLIVLKTYDTETGKPNVDIIYWCINYRWYRLGHWAIRETRIYRTLDE